MVRPKPPQEEIDKWARKYNEGWSIRQVAGKYEISYGKAHMYISRHPTVTMRGVDGKPRRRR